jgi:hypothetical protein
VVVSLLVAFSALAYYISIELFILVLVKFRRHGGLYFWSIIVTIVGIVLQTSGYILIKFENTCPVVVVLLITEVGWVANVTGLSLVLYSRLHLVIKDRRILKGVLIMIIVDGVICHGSVLILEFGSISKYRQAFYEAAKIAERMQQTVFATQESFLAILYIFYTCRFFDSGHTSRTRNLVIALVAMQVLVVAMDILLTTLFFTNKNTLKCMLHPLFYALKVRLEFVVLNMLRGICRGGIADNRLPFAQFGSNAIAPDDKGDGLSLSRTPSGDGVRLVTRSWNWADEGGPGTGAGEAEGAEGRVRQRQESEQTMVEDWEGHFTGGPSWKPV